MTFLSYCFFLFCFRCKLANNFELPRNPHIDIWYFYKTLTCITYLEDDQIRVILKLPLMNTKDKYEVYKIYNLPLPINHIPMRQTYPLTKYKLEFEMLLVSKDKAKFSFLTETMYHVCNSKHLQFCNPETAFYQTNVNKYCVVALFMQDVHDINTFCKQMVVSR